MPEKQTCNLPEVGGRGDSILEGLAPGSHHQRETLRLLNRAVLGRWEVPDKWCKNLPKVAAAIALDDTCLPAVRLAAIKLLHSMTRDSIDAAIALERLRVDEGIAGQLTKVVFNIIEVQPPGARPPKRIASTQRRISGNGKKTKKRKAKRTVKRKTKDGGNGQKHA